MAVYDRFQAFGIHSKLASLWESIDVFLKAKGLVTTSVCHLQLIILPSLTLKPTNVTHQWIEEDLIYTSVHQAFDCSCTCIKGVFGRRQSIFPNGCQYIVYGIIWNFTIQNGGGMCFYAALTQTPTNSLSK